MKTPNLWTVAIAGALYGLAMRLAFGWAPPLDSGRSGAAGGAMLASFVLLVPMLIGAYFVWADDTRPRKFSHALFGPWLPTVVFVASTAVLLIEGSICIFMAMPIFVAMSSVGGVLAWLALRFAPPSPGTMRAMMLLPLAAGFAETQLPLRMPDRVETSSAEIHVKAPPEALWRLINRAERIEPSEMSGGVAWAIGVPYPVEAVTREEGAGRVRKLRWGKGVQFDEPIVEWEPNRRVRWTYSFDAKSFPPGALDEHVLIGGKYFDLVDTAYTLSPEPGGTLMRIDVKCRVSTNFNFYAARVGRWLVGDAAEGILRFYKARAERS